MKMQVFPTAPSPTPTNFMFMRLFINNYKNLIIYFINNFFMRNSDLSKNI